MPLPVLLAGLIEIHEALLEAVQPHVLADAFTDTLPAKAVAGTLAFVGLREKLHPGGGGGAALLFAIVYRPNCVTVSISEYPILK